MTGGTAGNPTPMTGGTADYPTPNDHLSTEYRYCASPVTLDCLRVIHDLIADALTQALASDTDRLAFELAVIEVVGNLVEHSRASTLDLHLHVTPDTLTARISDDGVPFHASAYTATDMPAEGAESGRGLPLVRTLCTSLDSTRRDGRNTIELHRTLRPPQDSSPMSIAEG